MRLAHLFVDTSVHIPLGFQPGALRRRVIISLGVPSAPARSYVAAARQYSFLEPLHPPCPPRRACRSSRARAAPAWSARRTRAGTAGRCRMAIWPTRRRWWGRVSACAVSMRETHVVTAIPMKARVPSLLRRFSECEVTSGCKTYNCFHHGGPFRAYSPTYRASSTTRGERVPSIR